MIRAISFDLWDTIVVDDSDEPSPGFGAMAALAALGAAMFAGRRGLLDEQDAE